VAGRFTLGDWTVSPELNSLDREGQVVHLEPKIMQVLVVLAEQPGHVVAKKQIFQRVWPDTFVSDEVLTRSISELRKVFEDNPREPRYIQTISKSGYRLVAPVIEESRPSSHWKTSRVVSVSVVALAALLTAVWYLRPKTDGTIQSLAVMPFVNVTADPPTDYLSDGITESLIHSLSQLPDLTVRPRSSVFRYKGKDLDPRIIARELNVQAIVTGRITHQGDSIVLSAELVDARNNRSLWGENYEGDVSDVLRVQRKIASELSARLRENLTQEQKAQVSKTPTADPEAYQWYLTGRYLWEKRTPDGLEKARDLFNQAIARDPNFAQAYAGLADYWAVAPDFLRVPLSESLPNEKTAALKALALDNASPDAHLAMANAFCDNWEWLNAEGEFRRALELDPTFANAHHWYGLYLSWLGRHQEAIAHLQRAVELDPTNLHYRDNLGEGYQNARQYDHALEQLNMTVAIDPNFAIGYGELGDLYRALGKYDLWLLNWKKKAALNKNLYRITLVDQLSQAYAAGGYSAAVHQIIQLQKQQLPNMYVDPANIAYEYAALGNNDEAFQWLEKGYAERSRALQWIQVEPSMDGLRSDPRYTDLLRRMGMRQ